MDKCAIRQTVCSSTNTPSSHLGDKFSYLLITNCLLHVFMQPRRWLFIWNVFSCVKNLQESAEIVNAPWLPPKTPTPGPSPRTLDQPESAFACSAHFRSHSENLQLVSSIQMKQAGSQMRPILPRSGSGGARRGSRSQIEVCVNDSSNSLSCVMLTARLSWINSDAHSRPGIWFQMEHKSGRWNVQFCYSLEEAYCELEPVLWQ